MFKFRPVIIEYSKDFKDRLAMPERKVRTGIPVPRSVANMIKISLLAMWSLISQHRWGDNQPGIWNSGENQESLEKFFRIMA